ncbi:hypothetical protein DFH11DRAFT_1025896 [Phellopilus nigrolimitatus]|nr:hypothetical protein DFH11DRAFT_1025896 [Phellopilus nigrolimitatus]
MNASDVDSSSKYNESFAPVISRKKKRRKQTLAAISVSRSPTESVDRMMAELRSDSVWKEKCWQIIREALGALSTEIKNVLCLGLGSPTESVQARFQLCFLLELRDEILPQNQASISAFDPIFSSQDTTLLTSLGVQILSDNQHGKHILSVPTLVFMPHCDRELYEGLLRANWRAPPLANLVLIGNELCRYTESISSRILGAESPCVSRLAPLLASERLPEHGAFPNAFSSTGIQHISAASLASQATGFWELPEEIRSSENEDSEAK